MCDGGPDTDALASCYLGGTHNLTLTTCVVVFASCRVIELTARLLPIFALSLPGDGCNIILQGLLRCEELAP
jgi:Na+-driven multidrug efflux pump